MSLALQHNMHNITAKRTVIIQTLKTLNMASKLADHESQRPVVCSLSICTENTETVSECVRK